MNNTENRISAWGQTKIYLGKCMRMFQAEKQWKNFISTVIIILLITSVLGDEMFLEFRPTKNGCFAVLCASIWTGMFNSIQSICRERAIIKREHRTGLRISSYLLAHAIYEMFLCVVESLIITIVLMLKNSSHLPESGVIFPLFFDLYLTLFLTTLCADLLAVMVSCIVKNENSAMTVMPFILIIQLVFSGCVFDLSGISEKISNLTATKWGMNALLTIAGTEDQVYLGWRLSGADYEINASTLASFWLVLLLFCCVSIAIGILVLSRIDSDQR